MTGVARSVFRSASPARRAGLALVLAALYGLASPPVRGAGRAVTFRAADGHAVAGVIYEASRRPAPGVVLVPMPGKFKDDWQSVAQRLADASITALAIDLPGQVGPADARLMSGWHADVSAGVAYLASRADVRPSSIGLAGASLGATIAAVAAAGDARVRSLVLVSASMDFRGIRSEAALRQFGRRPALLIASTHDSYAARSARALAKDAPGPRDVRWSETPAHGMTLLSRDADLVRAVVEWFQRTLA